MDFQYYLPGEVRQLPAELGYAFDRSPILHHIIANGPDGGAGTIFAGGAYHQQSNLVGVYRDRQIWKPYPGSNWHIGYYPDDPPLPAQLARKPQLPGREVQLGDGRSWLIPIARSCAETDSGELCGVSTLPRKMELTPDRRWVDGAVIDSYAQLYKIGEAWWDYLIDAIRDAGEIEKGETVTLAKTEAADWCCTVLSVNYRVSAVEVWLLDLLNDLTRGEILNVVVDLQTWLDRVAKKNADPSASWNTSDGSEDSIRNTDLVSLT